MRYKKYIYIEEENLKKRGRGLGNIKGFFSYIGKSYYQALKRWKEKKNYVMRKLNTPKRVTLPDDRTFLARYERVPRSELPPNIIMRRPYVPRSALSSRRRRAEGGEGIFRVTKNSHKCNS